MSDKPEFSRSELHTVRRACAIAYTDLMKTIRRAQRAIKAGKKTKYQPSGLAMEVADYKMLFDKLDVYFKAMEGKTDV